MRQLVLMMALLVPMFARADTWVPLDVFNRASVYEIDPSSIQPGTRTDAAKTPVIGIWVRFHSENGDGQKFQVWVECLSRESQTYGFPFALQWSVWAPIAPESLEWAVYEYLCPKRNKK